MRRASVTAMASTLFEIKATLNHAKPAVWRTFLIPADFTFEQLHVALQILFGWKNCHLHQFTVNKHLIATPDDEGPPVEDERTLTLSDVIKKGTKFLYEYDFGDSWEVALKVLKERKLEPGQFYPACIDGKRAGPPEDCGGIPGFEYLVTVLKEPAHPEHDEMREWAGRDYNPEAFNAETTKLRLLEALSPLRAEPQPLEDSSGIDPIGNGRQVFIQRSAFSVRGKQPFLDWLKKNSEHFDSEFELPSLDQAREDPIIYLVAPLMTASSLEDYLKFNCDRVFVSECSQWTEIQSLYPKKPNYKMLREWFDIELMTQVVDLPG